MEPDECVLIGGIAEMRGECFQLTPELRWRVTWSGARVLQQKSVGNRGGVCWDDVPTVMEVGGDG